MFEKLSNFFNKMTKPEVKELASKDAAKERLHLVLMQDRANVSVDFLELMKQEIIDVIKKYIVVDENAIDVRLTNQENADGTNGAPSLYANIPILNIKNDIKAEKIKDGTLAYENGELGKAQVSENLQKSINENDIQLTALGVQGNNDNSNFNEQNKEVVEVSLEAEIIEDNKQNNDENINLDNNETKDNNSNIEENNIQKNDFGEKNLEENDLNYSDENKMNSDNLIEQEPENKTESNFSSIEIELEKENSTENFSDEEDDEDDDDVTFDDLLKAAEEEDKKISKG